MKNKKNIFLILLFLGIPSFILNATNCLHFKNSDYTLGSVANAEEEAANLILTSNGGDNKKSERQKVVLGGSCIGVKLITRGVLVIGFSFFKNQNGERSSPAKDAGIKEGDIILSANGETLNNCTQLKEIVENPSLVQVNLVVERKGKTLNLTVKPQISEDRGEKMLGAYIRNSSAGIGTLTYINPADNSFGALGHGISDIDTGDVLSVSKGSITNADVIGITKGERGKPGELRGVLNPPELDIGQLYTNNAFGIFGEYKGRYDKNKLTEVAYKNEVREGEAQIVSTIDEGGEKTYNIQILKVNRQIKEKEKGMIIRVIDERLLEKTGGIVQGMSGSPIIQNGKLVGAVTHVFVNDPTRGYGIFIENMLAEAEKIK